MARRWLPALRGSAPPPAIENKGIGERIMSTSRGGGTPGQPWPNGDWWVDKAVAEGFEVNPWVYRCVMKKAQASIDHQLVLRYGDPDEGEVVPIRRDPTRISRLFNLQANPWERGKMFRYRMVAQHLLSPKGVFMEVVRALGGGYAMFDLWDPDLVDILPAGNIGQGNTPNVALDPASVPPGWADPIHSFRLKLSSGGYDILPRFDPNADAASQPRSILWIRSPHPTMLYRGVAPITAAALSVDLDHHARMYNRRFLENDGRPGGMVMLKGQVGQETIDAVRTRFEAQQRAGKTMVVAGDAMEYVDLSTHPRDAQWEGTRKATKEEILMIFGVPESVAGNASGRTFDNADAEWGIFWEEMKQGLAVIDDQLDVLTGGYDDMLFARHDLSKNWFLNRHKREAEDRVAADFAAGTATVDDVRVVKGQKPLGIPASRALWLPAGKVPVAAPDHPEDQAELAKLMPVGSPATDPAAAAQAGAEQGAALGGRLATNANAARSLQLLAGKDGQPAALEGKQSRERGEPGDGADVGDDAADEGDFEVIAADEIDDLTGRGAATGSWR